MKTPGRLLGLVFTCVGCTGQLPGSFRYQQQLESFPDQQKVNTKIDLLWVVDNSSSMDVSQKALRDKFRGFAEKYLKPYWDIRIAVITTDTYLANAAYQGYLNKTVPGTVNYQSYHLSDWISSRITTLGNSDDSRLQKLNGLGVSLNASAVSAGIFTQGLKYQDLVPTWSHGQDYARLLAGVHDGPIAGFCVERLPYFLASDNSAYPLVVGPQCRLRDVSTAQGPEACWSSEGNASVSTCVNTYLNDTVHSGSPILSTQKPSDSQTSDVDWVDALVKKFIVNVSAGSAGSGSERGFSSVLEFLKVNEASESAFFRKDALHGIIFLSDEDDQSMKIPDTLPSNFSPDTNYVCDLDALVEANNSKFSNASDYIQNQYKYCCAEGNGCVLKNSGCPSKVLEGVSVRVGVCPSSDQLLSVTQVKSDFDTFFESLEKGGASSYFVVSIVPTTLTSYSSLQSARFQSDDHLDIMPFYSGGSLVTQSRLRIPAVDSGERYVRLANLVGNGSLALDIGSQDYSALLESIGRTIVQKKSVFHVNFAPSSQEEMTVKVLHGDGSETIVQNDQYTFEGKTVTITDEAFVLSLSESDSISINYQPKNLK